MEGCGLGGLKERLVLRGHDVDVFSVNGEGSLVSTSSKGGGQFWDLLTNLRK